MKWILRKAIFSKKRPKNCTILENLYYFKKSVLEKAGLCTLNEMVALQTALMVWKSNKARDPLGINLFHNRSIVRPTRSINWVKATQPVLGNNTLAANLMVRAWNYTTELQTLTTIGAAKSAGSGLLTYLCFDIVWPFPDLKEKEGNSSH